MEIMGRTRKPIKQKKKEFLRFCELIDKLNPKAILEIGVLRGGLISYYRGKCKVFGIDMVLKPEEGIVKGNSHHKSTFEQIKALIGGEVDVLFIDADHSYGGAKMDHEMYGSLVRKGGIIAFHDIINTAQLRKEHARGSCADYWAEIKNSNSIELIDEQDLHWGGIGVIYK